MLEFQLLNTNPLIREGITCILCDASVIIPVSELEVDFCFCDYECEESMKVFSGTNEREKDYHTLYYKSLDETSVINFYINDELIINEDYGQVIPNGFIVDFTKVHDSLGAGLYTLKTEILGEFGEDNELSFGVFNVQPFSLISADGTIKIKAIQSGRIESGFDFEGENVPFYIRLDGVINNRQKVDEFIHTQNNGRVDEQIHDRWHYEYNIVFSTNNPKLSNLVLNGMMSGTEVYISDYNLFGNGGDVLNNKRVVGLETTITDTEGTNTSTYDIKLEDAIKNNIKRPFIKKC